MYVLFKYGQKPWVIYIFNFKGVTTFQPLGARELVKNQHQIFPSMKKLQTLQLMDLWTQKYSQLLQVAIWVVEIGGKQTAEFVPATSYQVPPQSE